MQKYLLVVTQNGCGCDYMIDCGKTYKFLEFENDQKALEYVNEYVEDHGGPSDDEYSFVDINLMRVGESLYSTDDYDEAFRQTQLSETQRKAEEKEAQEKAELERLKAKYE